MLVDGIDEVPKQRREHTREWLRELLAAYPDAHYAVTTRPSAVPERWLEGLDFTELTVRPMNRRDVTVFVSRWHAAAGAPPELRESLKDAVRGQRDLAQLATTPLMCALMCALHRDRRGHLPHGRLELYEAALSMLLVRRDDERDIGTPEGIRLNRHQAVQLLQRLAYWLIRNGQAEMEEETALAVVEEALPSMPAVSSQGDAVQVLGHLVSRCGLLRRPTADTIDFVHRTFQDYLGGRRRPWRCGTWGSWCGTRTTTSGRTCCAWRWPMRGLRNGRRCCGGLWRGGTRWPSTGCGCTCSPWRAWSRRRSWIHRCGRWWRAGWRGCCRRAVTKRPGDWHRSVR
ncbi:hypothetical protein GCM10020000_17550 [Streptomyces olivoverticillatus]